MRKSSVTNATYRTLTRDDAVSCAKSVRATVWSARELNGLVSGRRAPVVFRHREAPPPFPAAGLFRRSKSVRSPRRPLVAMLGHQPGDAVDAAARAAGADKLEGRGGQVG